MEAEEDTVKAIVRNLLKILNPVIWCINAFRYFGHLESQRFAKDYEIYDFSKDIKHF